MDRKFSIELKELVAKSREMAIDLGYNYISTIHFFLADCESNRDNSLVKFGFKDEHDYADFKKHYTLEKKDLLKFINSSLPLTKEAEATVLLSETERKLRKHKLVNPEHFFIAALKNKDSLFFECFKHDENILEKLLKYYKFENEDDIKMDISKPLDQIANQENKAGLLNKIKKILGLIK